MTSLTILANFFIDDEETFLRMQDSFHSFKDIEAKQWVINVRGSKRFDTLFFLHEQLGDKLIPHMLESRKGWFHDTREMLKDVDTDYLLLWIEDHINLADTKKYTEIIREMRENDVEYMTYSWWHLGELRRRYHSVEKKELENISTFLFNEQVQEKILPNKFYIINITGIFSINFFKKLIRKNPFLRAASKYTPINIEKSPKEKKLLPIKYAIPKYELFASIDDDRYVKGYTLQERGLYPTRIPRQSRVKITLDQNKTNLNKDASRRKFFKRIISSQLQMINKKINRFARRIRLWTHIWVKDVKKTWF